MNRIVNNIQLMWKLAWMLKKYRMCNSTMRFLIYEFYNILLSDVTLLSII